VRARAFATVVSLVAFATTDAAEPPAAPSPSPTPTPKRGELIEVPAEPAKGFHFPYLLFIPESAAAKRYEYLLVEPNNTGNVSDDFEVHRNAAVHLARDSSVGNFVARKLGVPLLVPIFPRPASNDRLYTHSLDRDTILITDGPLARLDLQLIAMIADARPRLAATGHPVNSKVLINGFSASGLFANRFTFLHPEMVAAAAYGGLNCFIMLPVAELKSQALNFPLGLADLEKLTGHPFNRAVYETIPQLAYMGANDTNDAVVHEDAYSPEERALVFTVVGEKMMPDRWQAVQAVYKSEKVPVEFRTYPGIGHGTDGKINSDVAEFFRAAIEKAVPPKAN
jgi:hypothetical protein